MGPVFRHCPCFRPAREEVRVLDYAHCGLEEVPSEVFNYERTLEELYLNANQIKDLPRPLFHCHGLRRLNLSDNDIQSLPPAIAALISLEELDISKNNVTEIPDNINGCKCLSIVEASVNPVGKLPDGFMQLINIEQLYLNDTFLEYLPANFGRLSKLKILELRENHLKVLPKSMARLTELSRLDIGQNDFVELPEVVGSLPSLTELWCDNNQITCLPAYLGNLAKLTYLDASRNKISYIAEEIEGLARLTDFTLSSNRLQKLPETIGGLQRLTTLRMDDNHLATLPDSIGQLSNLEELVISRNCVDSLPSTVGLLRSLLTLIADDNVMEDLPPEIGSCGKLRILSLRDNRLTSIPDELGHLSSLRVVNLSGNQLRYLPVSLAKLGSLHALWLSENQTKPLVLLQSDVDHDTGQRVLTCFLLPQESSDHKRSPDVVEDGDIVSGSERRGTITFACDIDVERPRRLVRLPTPYPKELKARARHARNLYRQANGTLGKAVVSQPTSQIEDFPSEGRTSDKVSDLQVKEAKVVRPVSSSPPDRPVADSDKRWRHDAIKPAAKPSPRCLLPPAVAKTNGVAVCTELDGSKPVENLRYEVSGNSPPAPRQHGTSAPLQHQPHPKDHHRETLGRISEHPGSEPPRPRVPAPPTLPPRPPHGSNGPLRPDFHNVVAQLNEKFRIVSESLVEQPGYQSDHETYVQPPKTLPPPYHDGYSSDWDSATLPCTAPLAPTGVQTRLPRHLHPVHQDVRWPKTTESPQREQTRLLLQYRTNLRTSRDGYSLPLDRGRDPGSDTCP